MGGFFKGQAGRETNKPMLATTSSHGQVLEETGWYRLRKPAAPDLTFLSLLSSVVPLYALVLI